MNLTITHTDQGKLYTLMTRSGRRYSGATMEEAERKELLAELHALRRQIGDDDAYRTCASLFEGVASFGDLEIGHMRQLRQVFRDAVRFGKKLEQSQRLEPGITEKQRKAIIRLGKYVLGPVYGDTWLFKKLKEWIPRFADVQRVDIGELTNSEAWYVIRRLEKIEAKAGHRDTSHLPAEAVSQAQAGPSDMSYLHPGPR